MRTISKYVAAIALAGALPLFSFASDGGMMHGTMGANTALSGSISAISGNTVTVTVNDASKLHVGDSVSLFDRALAAINRAIVGTVSATGNGSFTVQQRNGKAVTVNTSASTTVRKDGQSATLADVAQGAMVIVKGAFDSAANAISATAISVMTHVNAGLHFGRHHGRMTQSPSPTPTPTQ